MPERVPERRPSIELDPIQLADYADNFDLNVIIADDNIDAINDGYERTGNV